MKPIKLTQSDWTEIYYAIQFKRDHSPAVDGDTKWKAQLASILNRIGPDGDDAAKRGVNSCRSDEWTVLLLVPAAHANDYGKDIAVIKMNARTILAAVKNSRRKLIRKLNDPELKEGDIHLVACMNGTHENLAWQHNKLFAMWGK